MKKESKNLMSGLLKEMNRCRELKAEYDMIPTGFFGSAIIQTSIKSAEKAIEENDVVKMLVAYDDLKKCTG